MHEDRENIGTHAIQGIGREREATMIPTEKYPALAKLIEAAFIAGFQEAGCEYQITISAEELIVDHEAIHEALDKLAQELETRDDRIDKAYEEGMKS